MTRQGRDRIPWLIGLIAVQSLCAAFFLWDVIEDMRPQGLHALSNLHIATETLAALALVAGIAFETRYLMRLLRRTAHLEEQVSIASGAFHEIILAHFDQWRLSPAESDVAMFAIKGFSIAETARLRGSAEGTVKAQLNAVYRKSGVSGRGALLGLLVDDLLDGGVIPERPSPPVERP
jgi:DNA-binding CsgD family transcriptional regulator